MAKDRGGHGSEKRGVSAVQARNDRMFAMFDRAKAQGHTGLYSGPAAPSGGGQPVASDAHAAATLAGGPKSAPVETHSAFEGGRADRAANAAAAGSHKYPGSGTGPGGIGERELTSRGAIGRTGTLAGEIARRTGPWKS